MPIGTCRLCQLQNVELRDSHFMSAGFYKIARDESRSNPNPVLVSEDVSMISSEQAKDYLLCAKCEDRFNKGGEDWVLKNCWHNENEFPLRSALVASLPSPLSSPDFTISLQEFTKRPALDGLKQPQSVTTKNSRPRFFGAGCDRRSLLQA